MFQNFKIKGSDYQGERYKLPLVGDLAERYAGGR